MVVVTPALLDVEVEDGLAVGVVALDGEVIPAGRAHHQGHYRGDDGAFAGPNGGGDGDDAAGVSDLAPGEPKGQRLDGRRLGRVEAGGLDASDQFLEERDGGGCASGLAGSGSAGWSCAVRTGHGQSVSGLCPVFFVLMDRKHPCSLG